MDLFCSANFAETRRQNVAARSWLRRSALWIVGVLTCLTCACQPAEVTPPQATPAVAGNSPPPPETWDVTYMQGAKVGYTHTVTKTIQEHGRALVQTTSQLEMKVKRFGQTVAQKIELSSVETPAGQLVRFESRMSSGAEAIESRGEYRDGKLLVTTVTQGKTQTSQIPWQEDWGGFFAAEQSRRQSPLKPGEKRQLKALMPIFTQPADVRMEAVDYESTRLLTGAHELLRIKTTLDLGGGQTIESVAWTDRTGETLKEVVAGIGQETFRATKEAALEQTSGPAFDLGEHSTVKIARPLAAPHQTRRIVYRVTLADGDPARHFVSCTAQSVRSLDEHTAEITVQAIRPDSPEKLAVAPQRPVPADSAANSLIQSDDPRVVELAQSVAPDEQDPWRLAVALEVLVGRSIQAKNFSQAFATAAEVARSLEGDCTEHAVLLAALCRARKIPARVAMGLVYYPAEAGFAFHMWDEVWIADRWVPMDATLARGGIGAAHLKLADSNLDRTGAYAAFLPVFQVLGRLKIEIVSVELGTTGP